MTLPAGIAFANVKEKLASPDASVVTLRAPRNVCPSPKPDGVARRVGEELEPVRRGGAELESVPATLVLPAFVFELVSTGKFCSSLAPVSASPGSFGWTPSAPRSMPRSTLPGLPSLSKIEFPRTLFPLAELSAMCTPSSPLYAMTLPAPPATPPTALFEPLGDQHAPRIVPESPGAGSRRADTVTPG